MNDKILYCDFQTKTVNDEDDVYLTGRGVVLMTYFAWMDEKLPKAREILRRYCKYLGAHGYGANAAGIIRKLDTLDKDAGAEWIKDTYGRYVKEEVTLFPYLFPTTLGKRGKPTKRRK